jgi:hypothetical protein
LGRGCLASVTGAAFEHRRCHYQYGLVHCGG